MARCRGVAAGLLAGVLLASCTAGGIGGGADLSREPASTGAARCGAAPVRVAASVLQRAAVEAWIQGYRAACPAAPVELVRPGLPAVGAVRRGEADLAAVEEPPPAGDPGRAAACRPVGLPVLAVPVAVVHSLPGLPPLTVTPTLLARVFGGQVTAWNDPEVALANPGVELPARRIAVVRPAEPAAAEALSRFLTATVPDLWVAGPGSSWPAAGPGRASADVLADVGRTPGALGVAGTPARPVRGVAAASVDGGDGEVAPTPAAVRAAVGAGDLDGDPPDLRLTVDPAVDEDGAYPLLLVGYQVGCLAADDTRADSVEAFLEYVTGPAGQGALERLGYASLGEERGGQVRAAVAAVSED